jgi:hypothetical protein
VTSIKRKVALFTFVLLAATLGYASLRPVLREKNLRREEFRALINTGVHRTASVTEKRQELVRFDNISSGRGNRYYKFYVSLRFTDGDRTIDGELEYQNGARREGWENLSIGDTVEVIADPNEPHQFYAPEFLEFSSEALAPAQMNFYLYASLGAILTLLLGLLVFLRLKATPEA